jgi:hypothetical protein
VVVNDTTDNRSTASRRQALRALAIAPLAGLAILVFVMLWDSRHASAYPVPPKLPAADMFLLVPFIALRIAPFCFGAAAVFVLPGLLMWPRLRKPSYLVGGVWGFCATWATIVAVAAILDRESISKVRLPQSLPPIGPSALFGFPGAVSGVLYSWLVRKQSIPRAQGQ